MKTWFKKNWKIILVIILGLAFIFFTLNYNMNLLVNQTCEERGTFGDMFGFSNAIFSAFAFLAVIVTIMLQMEELKEQKVELKQTQDGINKQNHNYSLQRFENTFFQLLGTYHQIIDNMEVPVKDDTKYLGEEYVLRKQGYVSAANRNVFNYYFENCIEQYFLTKKATIDGNKFSLNVHDKDIETNYFNQLYIWASIPTHYIFSNYFNHISKTIEFINKHDFYNLSYLNTIARFKDLSDNDKKDILMYVNDHKRYEYVSFIKAQLSVYEIWWLTFYCLSNEGINLLKFASKYTLLSGHPSNDVVNELIELQEFERGVYFIEDNSFLYPFHEIDFVELELNSEINWNATKVTNADKAKIIKMILNH